MHRSPPTSPASPHPPCSLTCRRSSHPHPKAGKRDQQDAIDALSNNPRTHAGYLEAAETASMLMGAYGRVVWDKPPEDGPWIDWVDADRAIPEFVWDRLVAVTFWTELASDSPNVVFRHLQRYEKGREYHSLHQGTRDNLGRTIDLGAHPATAAIAARPGLTENGFEVPTDFRHFMYAPNMARIRRGV